MGQVGTLSISQRKQLARIKDGLIYRICYSFIPNTSSRLALNSFSSSHCKTVRLGFYILNPIALISVCRMLRERPNMRLNRRSQMEQVTHRVMPGRAETHPYRKVSRSCASSNHWFWWMIPGPFRWERGYFYERAGATRPYSRCAAIICWLPRGPCACIK